MTWYLLAILVWLILLFVQLILAILMIFDRRNLESRFYHPLGSGVDSVELLQKYSRIHGDVSIRVDAHIASPAQLTSDEVVLINQQHVYLPLLFPTMWTLMEIHKYRRNFLAWERREHLLPWIFALEILFAFGTFIYTPLIWGAVVVSLILIGFTVVAEYRLDRLRGEVMELANDLLELDSVEHARALKLLPHLGGGTAAYPFKLVYSLLGFILPF